MARDFTFPDASERRVDDRTADNLCPEALAGAAETAVIVRHAIGGLTVEHVAVITMRYERDMTYREIAAELAISEPAVHAMHKRAIARLRQSLELMGVSGMADLAGCLG
jgi:RNA polymerase sigma factor (sigma-70 family)